MTRRALRPAVLAAAAIAIAAPAALAAGGLPGLGPATSTSQPTYLGFYDAHKDAYLITETSSKAQAAALHVNYSAAIGSVKGAPLQYFIAGRAAAGQLSVFGSEPGEKDYNPLWTEVMVSWKPSAKPVLLTSDNQINALAKAGKLTVTATSVVLNAPITHVGKK